MGRQAVLDSTDSYHPAQVNAETGSGSVASGDCDFLGRKRLLMVIGFLSWVIKMY